MAPVKKTARAGARISRSSMKADSCSCPRCARPGRPSGTLHVFYRRDRVSVISALTVAPRRRRCGLYFDLHMRNITGTEVITFLRQLCRHLRGAVTLLWAGGKIHRRRDVDAFLRRHPRIEAHRFPSYAPELNPDEFVWTQAKRELSNSDHDGLVPLTLHVVRSLQRIGRSQALLRSCLHASDLPWP
jgi:DDE superfamily endonuclease